MITNEDISLLVQYFTSLSVYPEGLEITINKLICMNEINVQDERLRGLMIQTPTIEPPTTMPIPTASVNPHPTLGNEPTDPPSTTSISEVTPSVEPPTTQPPTTEPPITEPPTTPTPTVEEIP